jgi:hypothetical protein
MPRGLRFFLKASRWTNVYHFGHTLVIIDLFHIISWDFFIKPSFLTFVIQQFCVHISWKSKPLLQEHILYVVCSRVTKFLRRLKHLHLVTHLLLSLFTLGGEIHQASIWIWTFVTRWFCVHIVGKGECLFTTCHLYWHLYHVV